MITLSLDEFEAATARAIEDLPQAFGELLDNVFVVVEDLPSDDDLESVGLQGSERMELLGLYHGVSLDQRDSAYSALPDRVVLYRRPILAICGSIEEVEAEIYDTLVHELGHHFGLDDDEMPF